MSKNLKNWEKLMKIANIDREFLHIFWTTWENSMKFSGKMCFKITLKVTRNQGFTISLEDIFFEKPQRGGEGSIWPSPSRFRVNLKVSHSKIKLFWKFTKEHPCLSCAWNFCTFKSSNLNNYFEKVLPINFSRTLANCILRTIFVLLWTITISNFNHDLVNLCTMDDFNLYELSYS